MTPSNERLICRRGDFVCSPVATLGIMAILLLLSSGVPLFAQTAATGALKGVVTDPSSSLVSDVSIKVISKTTGQARTANTEANGVYMVPLLPPGEYSVEASAKGFKLVQIQTVEIHVTETTTMDIRLQVGTISETVNVQDIGELVQTNSSSL